MALVTPFCCSTRGFDDAGAFDPVGPRSPPLALGEGFLSWPGLRSFLSSPSLAVRKPWNRFLYLSVGTVE